ncbi:MAG TPA: DUF2975 domain-containing protein [Firmicutes bacterium]|nr:DUF2975 domain-containing protein [Bacillota bacterium]
MSQKTLSRWLKFIISLVAACTIAVYSFFVCMIIWLSLLLWDSLPANKNFSSLFLDFLIEDKFIFIWPILILTTAIPIFIALIFAWKAATDIGKDKLYSTKNAKRLRNIAILSAIDVTWFFAANIVLLLFNFNHPSIVILSFFIVLLGTVISAVFSTLSHFTQKAAQKIQVSSTADII